MQLASSFFFFFFSKATAYRLEALASLLVGVVLFWGVGILEGFPPCWRREERGAGRLESPTVSDASEHTDWMSEMSKSEASLPLRLLPLLPALLPGRLKFFFGSPDIWMRALRTAALIRVPSSLDWNPLPDKYPGRRNLLP